MRIADYHTHNGYSRCVKEGWTVADGWAKAQSLGISQLGISNHVHYNSPSQEYLFGLKEEIDLLQEPNLLIGVELDIDSIEGHCVLNSDTWDIVDYLIAGPHNQPTDFLLMGDISNEEIADYFADLKLRLINSMKQIPFQIWPHPFLQEFETTGDRFWLEFIQPIFQEILPIIADKGIAMEFNTDLLHKMFEKGVDEGNGKSQELDYTRMMPILCGIYRAALEYPEIQFSFRSDAHELERVGDIGFPIFLARWLAIPSNRILQLEKKH